jgi:hypothetical protein
MDEIPFYKKPIFWVVVWIVILVGLYAILVFSQQNLDSIFAVIFNALLLIVLFRFWMAFYAQFILPVRTIDDRSKIIQRLNRYLSKSHGPAIFIKDGRIVEKEGEHNRRAAGVIWIDSASAAVTRTAGAYKQVLGPGVHFTDDGEYLARWLDLHTQVQSLGPYESDLPFEKLPDNASAEHRAKFEGVQARRSAVSALTRDGIEIVPNINVVFRLDAKPAIIGKPGSRFGYDEIAVFKAISKEGIDPGAKEDDRRVAWNQIPALIAVDLWREYLAKFTLNQLFEATQPPPPEVPQPERPDLIEGLRPLPRPIRGFFARMLRVINKAIQRRLDRIEVESTRDSKVPGSLSATRSDQSASVDRRRTTALVIIIQMMKVRMTQTLIPMLDESGRLVDERSFSEEYKKLQERGLKILSVSVSALRLPPAIEERSIKEWNANWLLNAKAESERIERQIDFVAEDGKRTALLDYAGDLSRSLIKFKSANFESILKVLLERSRNEIIRDDRIRQRLNAEAPKKDQPDVAGALLSILARSGKARAGDRQAGGADGNVDMIDEIIERSETKDL